MNAVYLTNGTPRVISVGNRKITFKKATPRYFAYKTKLFPLVVTALKEIGEENVDDNMVIKIKDILSKEDSELLRHDFLIAPQWMRKKIKLV